MVALLKPSFTRLWSYLTLIFGSHHPDVLRLWLYKYHQDHQQENFHFAMMIFFFYPLWLQRFHHPSWTVSSDWNQTDLHSSELHHPFLIISIFIAITLIKISSCDASEDGRAAAGASFHRLPSSAVNALVRARVRVHRDRSQRAYVSGCIMCQQRESAAGFLNIPLKWSVTHST